mmetsp:Transcript_15473/g.39423  ORF Transcript_15473/g.39423 Transcript_15473/m.39423 type:complete len:284 (-) Transcript_15473:100-951(-)
MSGDIAAESSHQLIGHRLLRDGREEVVHGRRRARFGFPRTHMRRLGGVRVGFQVRARVSPPHRPRARQVGRGPQQDASRGSILRGRHLRRGQPVHELDPPPRLGWHHSVRAGGRPVLGCGERDRTEPGDDAGVHGHDGPRPEPAGVASRARLRLANRPGRRRQARPRGPKGFAHAGRIARVQVQIPDAQRGAHGNTRLSPGMISRRALECQWQGTACHRVANRNANSNNNKQMQWECDSLLIPLAWTRVHHFWVRCIPLHCVALHWTALCVVEIRCRNLNHCQ